MVKKAMKAPQKKPARKKAPSNKSVPKVKKTPKKRITGKLPPGFDEESWTFAWCEAGKGGCKGLKRLREAYDIYDFIEEPM